MWIDLTNILKVERSETKNIYSIFHINKAKGGTEASVQRCIGE